MVQLIESFDRYGFLKFFIDQQFFCRYFPARKEILHYRHIGKQTQFLMYDANAHFAGFAGVFKAYRFIPEEQLSAGRLFYTGDDFHESRLTGAVFTDQNVDLALFYLKVDIIERNCAGV